MTSTLLSQARVLNPVYDTDQTADVLICDGMITAVVDRILDRPEETEVIDCTGLVLGPGLVDLYSHSGEPGFEERETLDSLLKGGDRWRLYPPYSPPRHLPCPRSSSANRMDACPNPLLCPCPNCLLGRSDAGHEGAAHE